MINNPVYEGVKVKAEGVKLVKEMVEEGFYRKNADEKMRMIEELTDKLSSLYDVVEPTVELNSGSYNHYNGFSKHIVVESPSIISYLHEYRHHLQNESGVRYCGMTVEQDARAWSLRVFSKACPKSFEKSVKDGRVNHIKWSEEENRVVDDARYI